MDIKKITFDIYCELYKELKLYCVDKDIKLKDFLNNAIKEKLTIEKSKD